MSFNDKLYLAFHTTIDMQICRFALCISDVIYIYILHSILALFISILKPVSMHLSSQNQVPSAEICVRSYYSCASCFNASWGYGSMDHCTLVAKSFDDYLRIRICKSFPHSSFFPSLEPILVSLCVHASLLLFLFISLLRWWWWRFYFYIVAYFDG